MIYYLFGILLSSLLNLLSIREWKMASFVQQSVGGFRQMAKNVQADHFSYLGSFARVSKLGQFEHMQSKSLVAWQHE